MEMKHKERRVPVQDRAIKRVNRILDTALSLMADPAHKKVTTHLIAEHAEVSVGSVYQFFPNVESVKIALIERLLGQYYEHFSATVEANPNISDLSAFSQLLVTTTYEFYQVHPDVIEQIVASSTSQEFNEVNAQLNERIHSLMLNHLLTQNLDVAPATLSRKISVAIATGDMMTMFIWSANDDKERQAYLDDWKSLADFYSSQV